MSIDTRGLDQCRHRPIPLSITTFGPSQCCHLPRCRWSNATCRTSAECCHSSDLGKHRYSRFRQVLPPAEPAEHRHSFSTSVATCRTRRASLPTDFDQCCHRSTSLSIAALPTSRSVATPRRRSIACPADLAECCHPSMSVSIATLDLDKCYHLSIRRHRYSPTPISVATARLR